MSFLGASKRQGRKAMNGARANCSKAVNRRLKRRGPVGLPKWLRRR